MRTVSIVLTTSMILVAAASSSRAQSVSFGVSLGGAKSAPSAAKAKPADGSAPAPARASKAPPATGPTREQDRAWQQRVSGSKALRSLQVLMTKTKEAIENTSYPCLNLSTAQEHEIKDVFAELPTIEAVRKECSANTYGPLFECEVLRDDAKFQQAFTYLFSCELDSALKGRRVTIEETSRSMTASLGALTQLQSPEALAASDEMVPLIRERARQLQLDLSPLDAKIAEMRALEKGIFEKLEKPVMHAVGKNAAAEKASNDAVTKALANFGCKDCKVLRSVIVGKDYFYERNGFGVVTWRGKDALTLVKTSDAKVCGVVDSRTGQVAIGSKFVPNYNAYVPVRFLHLVRCP